MHHVGGQAYVLELQGDKVNLTQRSPEERRAEDKLEKGGVGQSLTAGSGATQFAAAFAKIGVARRPPQVSAPAALARMPNQAACNNIPQLTGLCPWKGVSGVRSGCPAHPLQLTVDGLLFGSGGDDTVAGSQARRGATLQVARACPVPLNCRMVQASWGPHPGLKR